MRSQLSSVVQSLRDCFWRISSRGAKTTKSAPAKAESILLRDCGEEGRRHYLLLQFPGARMRNSGTAQKQHLPETLSAEESGDTRPGNLPHGVWESSEHINIANCYKYTLTLSDA